MQQSTGSFLNEAEVMKLAEKDPAVMSLPRIQVGEIVEIRSIKFEVKKIMSRGRIALKMLAIPG